MGTSKSGKTGQKSKTKSVKTVTKYMIILAAATMLFSSFFWMTGTVEPQGDGGSLPQNVSNLVTYNVVPVVNESRIVTVGSPVNEIVAIPKRPDSVRQENLLDMLNASFEGVSHTTVELSNSYILFRFQADDFETALSNLSSHLTSFVGEVKFYGVYDGLVGSGRIQLIADLGLNQGDAVRAIVLERQDIFQTIGLQQSRVYSGPIVPATVKYVGGVFFRGVVEPEFNDSLIVEELGAINVKQAPMDSGGFEVSFIVSNESVVEDVRARLPGYGVSNVSVFRQGFVTLPGEIAMGGDLLQPTGGEASFADRKSVV